MAGTYVLSLKEQHEGVAGVEGAMGRVGGDRSARRQGPVTNMVTLRPVGHPVQSYRLSGSTSGPLGGQNKSRMALIPGLLPLQ